jgi:hypothetical protein
MSRRDALLTEWRTRLAECERQLALDRDSPAGQVRWTWLRQMQARLLRFLIKRYGGPVAVGSRLNEWDEVDELGPRAISPFVPFFSRDLAPGTGALPKPTERMRTALLTIHAFNSVGEHLCSVPKQSKVRTDNPVIVATLDDRAAIKRAFDRLAGSGIPFDADGLGACVRFWVRPADYHRARELLSACMRGRAHGKPAWLDALLIGGVAGGFAGVAIWAAWVDRQPTEAQVDLTIVIIWLLAGIVGGLVGGAILLQVAREFDRP